MTHPTTEAALMRAISSRLNLTVSISVLSLAPLSSVSAML